MRQALVRAHEAPLHVTAHQFVRLKNEFAFDGNQHRGDVVNLRLRFDVPSVNHVLGVENAKLSPGINERDQVRFFGPPRLLAPKCAPDHLRQQRL
jgi:hypothetical protein